jgi:ACS family tartrate transporter-like MFS transporter
MNASWLTPEEKCIIAKRLAAEDAAEHGNFWLALRDPRVVALGLINFGIGFGEYGVQLWLPQIVQAMGFTSFATGFLVALPFAVSAIALILWGRFSDRKRDRSWHVALPLLLAGGGLAVASVSPSNLVSLLALSCAVIGTIAFVGPFWSLPSSFLRGPAAAASIGLVRTIGAFGGFSGSFVVGLLRDGTGGYPVPMAVLACSLMLTAIGVLGLGRALAPRLAMAPAEAGVEV